MPAGRRPHNVNARIRTLGRFSAAHGDGRQDVRIWMRGANYFFDGVSIPPIVIRRTR